MSKYVDTAEFVRRAKAAFGERYDYLESVYLGAKKPITIICKTHGLFTTSPRSFLQSSHGCPDCAIQIRASQKTFDTQQFIDKAKERHGDKYDYSLSHYKKGNAKVVILCSEHGAFQQQASAHIMGQGCPKCKPKCKPLTKSQFIERAKKVHGDRYNYDNVEYLNASSKIAIVCKLHGVYHQVASTHLSGSGCQLCANKQANRCSTTDEFIHKAKELHGDMYDYSKVVYTTAKTPVTIECEKHGSFQQPPNRHLCGHGCYQCGVDRLRSSLARSRDDFIAKANEVHGSLYDYSEVVYVNNRTKVKIFCYQHGEFFMKPNSHLSQKSGCPRCASACKGDSTRLSTQEFISRAREVHGDKYDYSETEYLNSHSKVTIICPAHGKYRQSPSNHLLFQCKKCSHQQQGYKRRLTLEDFIEKARKKHGSKYDYSRVKYESAYTRVEIMCPKHGSFMQKPHHHLNSRSGCPACGESMGERIIRVALEDRKIRFVYQAAVKSRRMIFDFALRVGDKICLIEYQGQQHYQPHSFSSQQDDATKLFNLTKLQNKDAKKVSWCVKKGYALLAIPYWEIKKIPELLDRFLKSVEEDAKAEKLNKQGYKHLHRFCFFCGEDDYTSLQCHRIIAGGVYAEQNVLTVCASCHCKIHGGRIKIDRKYTQASSPLYIVHYWLDGEEFWRNEEIGMFATESSRDYHSGLGRSAKATGKRRRVQGTADHDKDQPEPAGRGEVLDDSALPGEKKEAVD